MAEGADPVAHGQGVDRVPRGDLGGDLGDDLAGGRVAHVLELADDAAVVVVAHHAGEGHDGPRRGGRDQRRVLGDVEVGVDHVGPQHQPGRLGDPRGVGRRGHVDSVGGVRAARQVASSPVTTDKPDLSPTAPAYAPPQPGTAVGPPPGTGPRRAPVRVLPNVLWTLAALVLVPAGLGLLVWGAGERYVRLLQMREEQAVVPTVAVFAGLLLLALVAVLGAWAPLAPMVSGLLWGVVPGVVLLLDPLLIYRGAAIDDLRRAAAPVDVGGAGRPAGGGAAAPRGGVRRGAGPSLRLEGRRARLSALRPAQTSRLAARSSGVSTSRPSPRSPTSTRRTFSCWR